MELNWNDPFLDRRMWILANLDNLDVSPKEALALLLIDMANSSRTTFSEHVLMEKLKVNEDEANEILDSLNDKGYLKYEFSNGEVFFRIDGVVNYRMTPGRPIERGLLQEFELEFGRGLSSAEMQRILNMEERYSAPMVIEGLNEAAVYDARSLDYIENVLASWKRKGLSLEDIQNGRR